jgi:ankyrin repeat protein
MKVRSLAVVVLLLQACRPRSPQAPSAQSVDSRSADAAISDAQLTELCEVEHQPELHRACRRPDKRLVEKILKAGTPVDERDACGRTPLMWTFAMSVPDVSLSMQPSQAEIAKVSRQLAAENGARMEVAWLLLDRGADGNAVDRDGDSVLLEAAGFGGGGPRLLAIVQRLLQQGADVEQRNLRGRTPLMASAWSGRLDVARLLLDKGASVTVRDRTGLNALDIARSAGRAKMTALLQEASFKD